MKKKNKKIEEETDFLEKDEELMSKDEEEELKRNLKALGYL